MTRKKRLPKCPWRTSVAALNQSLKHGPFPIQCIAKGNRATRLGIFADATARRVNLPVAKPPWEVHGDRQPSKRISSGAMDIRFGAPFTLRWIA